MLRAGVVVDAAPLVDTDEAVEDAARCAGDGWSSANAEVLADADEDEDDEARGGAGDFVRGDGEGAEKCAGRDDAGTDAGKGESEKAEVGTDAGSVKDDADAV